MLGGVAACDSGLDVQPAIVQWMEWPAEVVAAKPFSVHLLTGFPACHKWVFKSPHAFVRGYIHEVATPVCGQTRIFHLVTRN